MNYSMPPESYRTLTPEPAPRPVRVWDVVITVVLLVLLAVFAVAASYAGLFLALASDACGPNLCNDALLTGAIWFAALAPWVILLLVVVLAIVFLIRRRIAFWMPIVGAVLMIAMWFVGAAIAGAAVQQ